MKSRILRYYQIETPELSAMVSANELNYSDGSKTYAVRILSDSGDGFIRPASEAEAIQIADTHIRRFAATLAELIG
jgi:hypothetical protein